MREMIKLLYFITNARLEPEIQNCLNVVDRDRRWVCILIDLFVKPPCQYWLILNLNNFSVRKLIEQVFDLVHVYEYSNKKWEKYFFFVLGYNIINMLQLFFGRNTIKLFLGILVRKGQIFIINNMNFWLRLNIRRW